MSVCVCLCHPLPLTLFSHMKEKKNQWIISVLSSLQISFEQFGAKDAKNNGNFERHWVNDYFVVPVRMPTWWGKNELTSLIRNKRIYNKKTGKTMQVAMVMEFNCLKANGIKRKTFAANQWRCNNRNYYLSVCLCVAFCLFSSFYDLHFVFQSLVHHRAKAIVFVQSFSHRISCSFCTTVNNSYIHKKKTNELQNMIHYPVAAAALGTRHEMHSETETYISVILNVIEVDVRFHRNLCIPSSSQLEFIDTTHYSIQAKIERERDRQK